jgi:hypothetical protein
MGWCQQCPSVGSCPGASGLPFCGAWCSLVEAIGKALDAVGAWDARGFVTHCGYGGLKQQL